MSTVKKGFRITGKKSAFLRSVSPMLATLVKAPVSDPAYVHEVKLDGYRIVSYLRNGHVRLDSRSGLDYTTNYPSVAKALKGLRHDAVLDGEVCAINDEGLPDFDALQGNGPRTKLVYYVFDLLWLDGFSLMELPLHERKKILAGLVKNNDTIQYAEHFENGVALYQQMQELGIEGIVSKRKDSEYRPGQRGYDWLKVPVKQRQEFVIGGWAESERGRSFRSLLFGIYNDKKELEWVGRSGGGYKEKDMPGILKKLKTLETDESPFVNKVLDTKGARIHWMKPKLVANFEFSGFTKSGRIRKPATFLNFRSDKKPVDVVRELPAEKVVEIPSPKKPKRSKKLATAEESNWPKVEREKRTSRETFNFGNCSIELYNVDREIWSHVHKADLITYYHSMARYILPHLQDRPQSLHIKPVNAGAPGFYIKDMEGRQPDCADIFTVKRKHKKKGKRDQIEYLVCNNEETLLWMINLGCIDVNPWTSRISNYLQPDYIVIDLDPSDDDFKKAVEAAKAAKTFFDKKKLHPFVKTSGKTGIHLLLPCEGFSFRQARTIAENICGEIHEMIPSFTTTEVSKDLRGSKLYLDPNQNDEADTIAAAYSVRPWHVPAVSAPLEWKEVKVGLKADQFTIHTMEKRVRKKGDLFEELLNEKITTANSKALKSFE